MEEERSGNALGTHSRERPGARFYGAPLDEWAHENDNRREVAPVDEPVDTDGGGGVDVVLDESTPESHDRPEIVAVDESAHESHDRPEIVILDESAHENDIDEVAVLETPAEDRFADDVLEHHVQLARMAYMLTGDREIAEDSVTEGYARLWPKYQRGRMQDPFPVLVREVLREAQERTRRAGTRQLDTTRPAQFESPWAALLYLPFDQRSAVVLRVVEGLDLEESADLLGQPISVTAARVDAGMGRVAELLGVREPDA